MNIYQLRDVDEVKPKEDSPKDRDFSLLNLGKIMIWGEVGAITGYELPRGE
ncbi:hypothetical protein KY345_02035 [Candidatus Woesearchaeota archaeon]|nr:hypothetical protein [Candidatus Woesearchaeota archaeon]